MWSARFKRSFGQWFGAKGYGLLAVVLLAGAIGTCSWFLETSESTTRAAVGQTLDSVLNATERGLFEWFDARRTEAQRLAKDEVVLDSTRQLLESPPFAETLSHHAAQSSFRHTLEYWLKTGNYVGACIVNDAGLVLASTRDLSIGETVTGMNLRKERLLEALNGKTVYVPPIWRPISNDEPGASQTSNIPVLRLLTPIESNRHSIQAVLVLNVKLSDRFTAVLHAGRFGNTGEIFAFDRGGRLLTNTRFDALFSRFGVVEPSGVVTLGSELRIPPGTALSSTASKTSIDSWPMTRLATQAVQGGRGSDLFGYRNFLGQRVLGAWSFQDELEMGLGVEIDENEALAINRENRWVLWTLCGLLALMAFVSTHKTRILSNRLHRLATSIEKVTERRVFERTESLVKENDELVRKLEEHRTIESSLRVAQKSLEETSERFARLSQLDALTNLANRRRFDEFLEREWRRCIRYNKPISLILVDIDYFRLFNDAYGHGVGDDCLREIAGVISASARRSEDLAARLGGEEFAIVLCDTDSEGARAIAHHVRHTIENLAIDHEMTMVADVDTVTVSLGVATKLPEPNSGPSVLLYHADEALFLAKQEGRNCVRTYEDFTTQTQALVNNGRVATSSIWPQQALVRKP
jgi:diguanylate cyclase (GGDEF)-like protein